MQVRLVVTNQASQETNSYDLAVDEKTTLGRHLGSPVLFQGEGLSRHHFSFMVADDALTIEDHSSNGTWLNGALLKGQASARVASGDIVEVPGYEIRVLVQESVSAPKSQDAAPPAMAAEEPEARQEPAAATTTAMKIFEPREVALLLVAALSFALISFLLNR
jgi:hypothetical protein